jgi:hypothetical protein
MTGATFLYRPPGLLPKTKPLNVPEHDNSFSPLSLPFEKGCYAFQMSRPGEVTGHIHVATGGVPELAHSFPWLRHHVFRIVNPCPQPHLHTVWKDKERISILYLKMPHYLN